MADGYFRGLSGKAEVLVRGQRAPIIGNICMVMFMIDISDLKNVKLMMK
jgi:alanine racemase